MILGIMSDSHGNAAITAQAAMLLTQRGARKLLHCGDLCGENVLAELALHDSVFTWGNCDRPTPALRAYVAALGLPWPQPPVRLDLAGRRILLFHGHEAEFRHATRENSGTLIFHGHTHERRDHREMSCRVINPGALTRAVPHTVALFDLRTDRLTFLDVATGRECPI